MDVQRASGILLHPTSLPGPYGIGDLGPQAYRFVDFLAETGQSLWQVLPLGPTGYGNSPYMCFSAFGGNGMLVSPEMLIDEGFLSREGIGEMPRFPEDRVDYGPVIRFKSALLRTSFVRFKERFGSRFPDDFFAFSERNAFWLEDYALFSALKDAHDGRVWPQWDAAAAAREPEALVHWRNELADEIQFCKYVQYQFFNQWQALRAYCRKRGVGIIGDMPVYVAHDSAEVWAHRDLFFLDEHGAQIVVAGVPPDYFSATGQRWGNPIYRWDTMAQNGFQWWIDRFRMNLSLADMLRLDHFRGFEAYWEIPASEPTAVNGRWVKGPGIDLFLAVRAALGDVPMIAEDLGMITPEVDALREQLGLPGMRILQMPLVPIPRRRAIVHTILCPTVRSIRAHTTTILRSAGLPPNRAAKARKPAMKWRESAPMPCGTWERTAKKSIGIS